MDTDESDSSVAHGIHGTGTTTYTEAQSTLITALVRALNTRSIVPTVGELAEATGMKGNTIRAIMSEADGNTLLLGGNGVGYQIARAAEEGDKLTARLESQINSMQERVDRRRRYASHHWGLRISTPPVSRLVDAGTSRPNDEYVALSAQ